MTSTATQSNLLELARQGNTQALATLMNRQLQPKNINIKTSFANGCLLVIAESDEAPEQRVLVDFIRKGITNLKPEAIKQVVIQGRSNGNTTPTWRDSFDLQLPNLSTQGDSLLSNNTKNNSNKSSIRISESNRLANLLKSFVNFQEVLNTAFLLGILLVLTVNLLANSKPKVTAWEYKIETIDDVTFNSTIQQLGSEGWELASARRAVSGEGATSEGVYEVIFKRPK